ncbi:MAG TPA: hypothetical protein VLF20_02455 [Patescibacteria group bacterium]|nr:hypothetical protein [Patescibacteria group bacterium]
MKTERVILSFIAVIVGLIAAGAAFYFYQMTKEIPDKDKAINLVPKSSVSPTPDSANLLTIDSPKEEEVTNKKTITVSGNTRNDATVMVSTEDVDEIIEPADNGNFSVNVSIPSGTTIIYITAIFPNGEEQTVTKTVTYSTEEF